MSRRAQYRDELLRIAEPYPTGARTVVFCRYMVVFAQWAGISLEQMVTGLRRAAGNVAVEPVSPSVKGYKDLDRLITNRLNTPPHPPPSIMYNVLRECVLDGIRKGVPFELVEGFLADWSGGSSPLSGFTALPAWVRR